MRENICKSESDFAAIMLFLSSTLVFPPKDFSKNIDLPR